MHIFYKLDIDININRTVEKPYEIYIEIHYFNEEFKQRIKNLTKKYRPAFEVKYKNFIARHLHKDKFKIKLVSCTNKEYRAAKTGNYYYLSNLNSFDFERGVFSFVERNEAEEMMYKMKKIIGESLDKEALVFQRVL
ncbi:hypothetical protein ACIQHV_27770 [Bacillus bombysepticus]|uniref:Uncharacterized protein n=1 Tax=Bacillus thuringiensis serovar kumamotoensis TaxID=132267 RepID=A0A9X6PR85_BACUK|nr:hypothetical protein [Bacillus thuringiensis]MEC2869960.1 hypothetical protein [Bacillus cereus]OTZ74233.1 hypothetical protein BK769_13305 [Bacillus thuringiensis serovar kumamtoensis]